MRTVAAFAAIIMAMVCSASADELWVCKFRDAPNEPSPTRYWLHEKVLQSLNPLWPYQVLIDNDTALVAAAGEGMGPDYPGLSDLHVKRVIQTMTVEIDRTTGEAIFGVISLDEGPSTVEHASCHKEQAPRLPDAPHAGFKGSGPQDKPDH